MQKRHKGRPARDPVHLKVQQAVAAIAEPVSQLAHTVELFKQREKTLIDTLNDIFRDIHKRLADLEMHNFGEVRGEQPEEKKDVQVQEVREEQPSEADDATPDSVQDAPGAGDGDAAHGNSEGDSGV
jgi:hypothetical protein